MRFIAMPTIDLTNKERAAVTAAIRRLIEEDRFPMPPRLVPLRFGLAKLEPKLTPERQPPLKAPSPARGGKQR
jgi:hypothetical protein